MRLPKPNLGWLLPVAATALALILLLLDPLPLRILRNAVFDQYQRWSPRVYQPVPVRIVDIDDASLARLGQWPWPRTRMAELTERLQQAGAAAIAFDMIFAEPDRTSPKEIVRLWRPDAALRDRIASLPDHDAVFASTIARGGVVLGHAMTRGGQVPAGFQEPFRSVNIGPSPLPFLHPFAGTVAALPALQAAAAGNGAITFVPDTDGVVRRVPMLTRLGEHAAPSLVAEALRVGQGAKNYVVKTSPEAGAGIESVRVGGITVPTTAHGEFWVRYSAPAPERYVPAWRILDGSAPAETLRDHIVLVGSSAQGLMDLRFSPLGHMLPGVETHAQALEQILAGEHLGRPNWAQGLEALGVVVGGLLTGFIGVTTGALLSAAAAVVVLAVTFWGGWHAYVSYGLLLDPLTPGLAIVCVFILASLWHHVASERRQRWVRQAFSRYVSPNLVNHLVDHPGALVLGGTRRECSFIFTDLAGFTNLMEKLDPVEAVALLNDYLDNMIRIAFEHAGTLDRIVGDAVAIMFSAPVEQPDHRQRALRCAIDMHRFAQAYTAEANARGIAFGATRIGIHTGEVTVGNFGGATIFDYRALGDPVNTSSRLESVNKQLGTHMCLSEATLSGCPDAVTRPVGRLVLKGKTESLMVYEPILSEPGQFPEPDRDYESAYALLAARDPAAVAAFETLASARPGDGLVAFQLGRARRGQLGETIVFTEK
jgi:adenylate cyclase